MVVKEEPRLLPRSWGAAAAALAVFGLGAAVWLLMDVDSDGAPSYEELKAGTSPMDGDSDGDGLADGWEAQHGSDPLAAPCTPTPLHACQSEAAEGSRPTVDSAPSGGSGGTVTFLVAGLTTMVAGVAARVISTGILHK